MTIVEFNFFSISLVLVPALFNLGILAYLYIYLPKTKLTNLFSLFLVALMFWQVEELILRSDITEGQAIFWDQVIAIGWLAIGPLVVHFACLYSGLQIIKKRSVLLALYFPYLFFFSMYQANPIPNVLHHHGFWGYTLGIRPDSFDLVQRLWLGGLVITGIIILGVFALKKELESTKRKQTLLIVFGLFLPTIQGFVTQIIFPLLGKNDIPVTTTMMTFFSIFTIVALSKYKLFDPYESIDIKSVFNAANSMVMIFSPDLYSKYYNPEVNKKLLNKSESGKSFHIKELFGGNLDGFMNFSKNVIAPVQNGEKILEYETVFTGTCGTKINILLSAHPVRNNRKIHFLLFVCHDITSRVSAELELIKSNERYAYVIKATNEAIRDWNIVDDVMVWEEGIDNLFGIRRPKPDNFKNNWINFLHPMDRKKVMEKLEKQLTKKKKSQWNAEYRFLRSDGSYAFVEDKAFIIRPESGNAIRMIGAIRDVTHQKEYLKAIEEKNSQLQEISWIQSHKVRAPLANIIGLVPILMDPELNEKEKRDFLESLQISACELDEIIRQIVSKAELA